MFLFFALEPPELRVASHFFSTTICRDATPFRSQGMKYVYLLQSLSAPTQRYVGVTTNLEERLQAHNAGASLYTSKYRPWKVVMHYAFKTIGELWSLNDISRPGPDKPLRISAFGRFKVPMWVHLKTKEPFALAGLWDVWRPETKINGLTFTERRSPRPSHC
jgi:GIY-YIG catalytic domain